MIEYTTSVSHSPVANGYSLLVCTVRVLVSPASNSVAMHDLTGFQRDLLYVIAGRDNPNGLAIKAALEAYYENEIPHGRLYPNLDTLVDKGLIEKGEADRRANYYRLTSRGQREIKAHREWEQQYLNSPSIA
jgi:PadR family transcriptional regulator, regulatory protein PadR